MLEIANINIIGFSVLGGGTPTCFATTFWQYIDYEYWQDINTFWNNCNFG
jgi:hypothetical protein